MQRTLLFACAVLACSPALAEDYKTDFNQGKNKQNSNYENTNQDKVFRLGQINIYQDLSKNQASLSTVKISQEDIKKIGTNNVADSIRKMTGAQITSVGPRDETAISIRGYNSKYIPVLVDGVPVRVSYDGLLDIGRYTTNELSEIQVSKGLSSVLNGANSLAGVVNLVTKKPNKKAQGDVKFGIEVDNNGSFNGHNISANAGSLVDKWYMQASGSYVNKTHFAMSQNFETNINENGGNRDNSKKRDENYFLKMGYLPQQGDELALSYNYQHAVKHTPVYAGTDTGARSRYWRWPYWDKEVFALYGQKTFDNQAYIKSKAFYSKFQNALFAYDNTNYDTQNLGKAFRSYYDDYSIGYNLKAGYKFFDNHFSQFAFHFVRDNHSEHNLGEPARRFYDDTYSVALEDKWSINKDLDVILGASIDKKEAGEAQDYQSNQITKFMMDDKTSHNFLAMFNYKLSKDGTLHGGISRKTRFPTMKDRYSYRLGRALPNPDLKIEKAYNFEIGYSDILRDNTNYDITFFYSKIKDAIQNQSVALNTTQMQNVGKASSYGFELALTSFAFNDFEQGLNYSFLYKKNDSFEDIKMLDAPKHKLFYYIDYSANPKLHIIPSFEYNSSRFGEKYTGGLNQAKRLSGFIKADLKVSYEPLEKILLEAGVKNLNDANYELYDGFYEAGRSYYLNASYKF